MKKFFTILLACVLTIPLSAQIIKTKKVAILEVVDREGTIGYGVKLQLRSSLTSAITQTPGYEGYDRVDMAAIFGEHDFQRTGAVSDEQIKKLGEMSGCDYVLITEAAFIDEENLLLVAKVVNVTTGRVEISADNMIATNANGIRKGGQELAARLFNPNIMESSQYQASAKETNVVYDTNANTRKSYNNGTASFATDLGARSNKTRFLVEGGLNLLGLIEEATVPLVFGASYGWLLSPTWFVGFNVYAGGLDTCCDDFNVIFGGHARAYLSQQNKSMYVGSRLGIGLWGLAVGPEVGYDFGKWSVGVSSWLGECAWTVGLVAGYNF